MSVVSAAQSIKHGLKSDDLVSYTIIIQGVGYFQCHARETVEPEVKNQPGVMQGRHTGSFLAPWIYFLKH